MKHPALWTAIVLALDNPRSYFWWRVAREQAQREAAENEEAARGEEGSSVHRTDATGA